MLVDGIRLKHLHALVGPGMSGFGRKGAGVPPLAAAPPIWPRSARPSSPRSGARPRPEPGRAPASARPDPATAAISARSRSAPPICSGSSSAAFRRTASISASRSRRRSRRFAEPISYALLISGSCGVLLHDVRGGPLAARRPRSDARHAPRGEPAHPQPRGRRRLRLIGSVLRLLPRRHARGDLAAERALLLVELRRPLRLRSAPAPPARGSCRSARSSASRRAMSRASWR